MILPDHNVWVSLVSSAHPFHRSSSAWIASVPREERIVFCRHSQLSLLRLLTTETIMKWDVMTQRQAWRAYEDLRLDPRVDMLAEPSNLELILHRLSDRDEVSPKRWNDDYLIAFAEAAGLTLVTFDRVMAGRANKAVLLTP